eukprot:7360733-Alexandrium_andersonii.AAC.1
MNRQSKRVVNFDKVDGIYVLDILMAPPKGRRPPDHPAGAGATGGWKGVQSRRTVRQTQQPPKSACADGSAAPVSSPLQSVRTDGEAAP